jgi:hypothetical protein
MANRIVLSSRRSRQVSEECSWRSVRSRRGAFRKLDLRYQNIAAPIVELRNPRIIEVHVLSQNGPAKPPSPIAHPSRLRGCTRVTSLPNSTSVIPECQTSGLGREVCLNEWEVVGALAQGLLPSFPGDSKSLTRSSNCTRCASQRCAS